MEPEEFEDSDSRGGITEGIRITLADVAVAALMPLKGFADGISAACSSLAIDLAFHSKAVSDDKAEKQREKLAHSVMSDIRNL